MGWDGTMAFDRAVGPGGQGLLDSDISMCTIRDVMIEAPQSRCHEMILTILANSRLSAPISLLCQRSALSHIRLENIYGGDIWTFSGYLLSRRESSM